MEERIDEVVTYLNTPAREVAYLDSFMANGFDILHCGICVHLLTLTDYRIKCINVIV